MAPDARPFSPAELARLRDEFPPLRTVVWFQHGGVSLTPRPVAAAHAALLQEPHERGPLPIAYPDEEYPRRRASLARIARFCGADPAELALMRGVSEAYLTVLRGLLSWPKSQIRWIRAVLAQRPGDGCSGDQPPERPACRLPGQHDAGDWRTP